VGFGWARWHFGRRSRESQRAAEILKDSAARCIVVNIAMRNA
jgi:hypothetical protein